MVINDINSNPVWTLITIVDPEGLPGKNIFKAINVLLKVIKFKFVILDYISGGGKSGIIYSLQKKQNQIINIHDFLDMLKNVDQFDWGDFFLFEEYPKNWDNPKGELYPYVIAQTDTTVRAVDDGYIYIYTPYKSLVNIIKENYEIESVKVDELENLDYPE